MHRLVHPSTKVCYWIGWLTGNVLFGANADWWRAEHDPHHAAPNAWDRVNEIVYDP